MDFDPETTLSLAGQDLDDTFNSVVPPLYQSAIFQFEDVGETKGYDYTRSGNPTRTALEDTLADLDGGTGAVACATGMAAVSTVTSLFDADAHLICAHDCYGGTERLFSHLAERGTLAVSYEDLSDRNALADAVRPETEALADRVDFTANAHGTVAAPFDSWLVLRGAKTLPVRLRQHETNARAIAHFLNDHPAVGRVCYPGLSGHPGHEIARTQQNGYGGMVSFFVDPEQVDVRAFLGSTEVFALAESLGGVESLIEHPATMSHASMAPDQRDEAGITDNLVRLSVGIESTDDLRRDLDQSLTAAGPETSSTERQHTSIPPVEA
ncbi:trans-sulfuration enzyme family protein [Salinibacter altiplanensis]|uniref:trans-sulfuration enzyme family protein n=1 Tax=Salinibacter altiplanensis TaxID=1803181 RepID=UPI000C9F5EE7|nr:PLP-dependent aspartate aminotransferase family protein [Salinibacter altiplanensis]